ncbi:xenotropic and polytropic retrovirus receptor 1 homolog isoform X5 [Rhipicephalus sanguineus]|uniref:xenotropic and polytropic retrovirus receptor 1 homolog isoform X5 n=1 Tax=Rhipicephalus sanguineus TaxID=34632 RepID=UPI0020C344E4|nr:xenotropic and polytropic retrovirus receptor 1 homolog isoform X5 [Rhipicephalus sanguineus]
MKFTEHLAAHITPEWRKQYISYEEMKTMLYGAVERAPSAEVVEQSVITRYLASFDEEFFQYCDKELAKINTFYSEKLAEATRKFSNLKSELNNYISKLESHRLSGSGAAGGGGGRLGLMRAFDRQAQEVKIHTRKIHDLKLAFSEFYLSLILLQNYQNLNFTGFRKILKKHDKLLGTNLGAQWRQSNVEAAPFYTNKDIDRLIQETESLVTTMLEGGDRQKAMKRLRVPPLGDQQSPWVTFKVGLFSGAYIVLIIAVILSGVFSQTRDDWRIVFRLYRGTLLIILFMFLIGVNVYGWRTSGVNHVLIFELDPRNHLSEQHLMEMAAIFGVLWALSVLAFLYSGPLAIPTYANPLALLLLMLVFLVNPLHTMRHQARFWLLRVLGRIFAAPFFYVGFADFWLADQLNSLVPVFIDAQYFVCFYATDFQWMENSDSYPSSSSHPFFILWILSAVVSSCFTYTWDVKMDWGLFDSNAGDNRFLREEIVYSSPAFCVELLPTGKRAPEQLRQVPSGARHLCGAHRCWKPGPLGTHDGRAVWRRQPWGPAGPSKTYQQVRRFVHIMPTALEGTAWLQKWLLDLLQAWLWTWFWRKSTTMLSSLHLCVFSVDSLLSCSCVVNTLANCSF